MCIDGEVAAATPTIDGEVATAIVGVAAVRFSRCGLKCEFAAPERRAGQCRAECFMDVQVPGLVGRGGDWDAARGGGSTGGAGS